MAIDLEQVANVVEVRPGQPVDRLWPRRRVYLDFTGRVSRTKQADKAGADINEIMRKYREKGVLPLFDGVEPNFGDFTSSGDFFAVMGRVVDAKADFEALPSHIRVRFANDPGKLIDFVMDPSNSDEAIKLGLKKPLTPVVPVVPAPVVPVTPVVP